MPIFKTAWRNLWRNRRRTLVTMGAITLALFVMILYSGLVEGYLISMEKNIVDLEIGDVQIFAEGYLDRPSIYERIDGPDALLEKLEQAGFRATARLRGAGLAAGDNGSAAAMLVGIDVRRDRTVSAIFAQVSDGQWLDPSDPSGIVIGRSMARTLGVKAGSEVVILTQGADGSMANDLYKVRGVLKSISDATDRAGVFMTTEAFRSLLVLDQGAHQLIVRRPDHAPLSIAGARISQLASGYDVRTWRQLLPTMADLMETQRAAVTFMFTIVYIAIGIVILNAMLMAVFERIREFGVLKAIGMSPLAVFRLILAETSIMTGISIAVGVGLSIPGLQYLSTHGLDMSKMGTVSISGIAWDPIWRAAVTPQTFSGPIIILVVIVLLATLYPALKAARLEPVRAIHHQ